MLGVKDSIQHDERTMNETRRASLKMAIVGRKSSFGRKTIKLHW
jgi:hypothetical protein